MHKIYKTQGTCSREIEFDIEDNKVYNVKFVGGCNGNLQGLSSLLVGMKVEEAITRLKGIKCRGSRTRETSCPDQISKALESLK